MSTSMNVHGANAIVIEDAYELPNCDAHARTIKVMQSGECILEVTVFGHTEDDLHVYNDDGDNFEVIPC